MFFIQMQQPSNTESLEPISLSSLVELSVVATPSLKFLKFHVSYSDAAA